MKLNTYFRKNAKTGLYSGTTKVVALEAELELAGAVRTKDACGEYNYTWMLNDLRICVCYRRSNGLARAWIDA